LGGAGITARKTRAANAVFVGRMSVRLEAAFTAARRAALMPFLMGGFPTLDASRAIGEAYAEAGADIVELGIPFAHAVADGPVIRAAGKTSLRAGATLEGILNVARALSARIPLVIMCYFGSVVLAGGPQRFADALANAGASGLIVPDMPPEEDAALLAACDEAGLALVPVVMPTMGDDELARVKARARGFLYAASATGTTGERATLADSVPLVVRRAKAGTPVPVALGFGISTPEHAVQAAAAGADGVVVGSRLVRAAAEATDPAAAVGALVAELSAALPARPCEADDHSARSSAFLRVAHSTDHGRFLEDAQEEAKVS
jgi:tryptophan synthase alpha chain